MLLKRLGVVTVGYKCIEAGTCRQGHVHRLGALGERGVAPPHSNASPGGGGGGLPARLSAADLVWPALVAPARLCGRPGTAFMRLTARQP